MFNINGKFCAKPIKENKPQIYITPEAYYSCVQCAKQCPLEISWFSRVEKLSEQKYLIKDVLIPKQNVTPASANFEEDDLSQFMTDIISHYGIEFYNEIHCWGHSHVNMSVNPSLQDTKQILEFKENEYYIMLIINKQGDAYVELYNFKDNTAYRNIPIELYIPNHKDIESCIKKCIETNVKRKAHMTISDQYDNFHRGKSTGGIPYTFYDKHTTGDAPYQFPMTFASKAYKDAESSGIIDSNGELWDIESIIDEIAEIIFTAFESASEIEVYSKIISAIEHRSTKISGYILHGELNNAVSDMLAQIYSDFTDLEINEALMRFKVDFGLMEDDYE